MDKPGRRNEARAVDFMIQMTAKGSFLQLFLYPGDDTAYSGTRKSTVAAPPSMGITVPVRKTES